MGNSTIEPKANTKKKTADFWVGIGASAGGLEALRGFVRSLPNDLPATYIVAQHMAPHHKSMLSEIIRRETEMDVLDVVDDLLPEPNIIYITPPNKNIIVKKDRLRLIDPNKQAAAPKPSVDVFFKSLAECKKKKAIGIIMSGTGRDGAQGVVDVHEHGGIVVAQDELSAKYASMPQAAIETGLVDLIMAPDEMGTMFANIVAEPRDLGKLKSSPANIDSIGELIQLLLYHTKVNFTHYKMPTLQRRIDRRIAAVNVLNLESYVKYVKGSPAEIQELYNDLLISVTSFFRDSDEFAAVEKYIENIVKEKKGDPIRVWVPGTATGEEAYSLAILFCEAARKLNQSLDGKLQIFATDLDVEAIASARRGYYSEPGLSAVPEDIINLYFETAPNGYIVKKTVRQKMVFSIHNLAQDPPFLNLDMISCRNLLIYFQSSLQQEVFSRFHYSLIPNGLLFIGKSEAITASDSMFRVADDQKHIFFQRPSHRRHAPKNMLYERPTTSQENSQKIEKKQKKLLENANARFESVVAALGPNGLLVNSDLQIIRSFGDVSKYVSINPGAVSNSITSLLQQPFRQDVQFSVPGVIRNLKPSTGITHTNPETLNVKERVMIYPLQGGLDEEVLALVVFKHWDDASVASDLAGDVSDESNERIEELGNELLVVKVNLRQTVEQLETSNEELQALNEEMQSSNEELQSTNEELETSNEELQSTNEELSTVNEELQVNSHQLNIVNYDLGSILQNLSMPLLVVDRALNITNVSRASEQFFDIAADLVLPHISRCRLPEGFPNLADLINQGISDKKKVQIEVEHKEQSIILTVVPHLSNSDEVMGAIVLLSDNTQLLRNTRTELQLIFDSVPNAIVMRTADGEILKANKTARDMLSIPDGPTDNLNFYDFFDDSVVGNLMSLDRDVATSNEPLFGVEGEVIYRNGNKSYVRMSRIPGMHPETKKPVIYGVAENITDQYEAGQKLKESEKRLALALNVTNLGIWEWNSDTGMVYFSKGITKFLGMDQEEFRGKLDDANAFIHPDDLEDVEAARQKHFNNKAPYQITYRMKRKTGELIWVESNGQAEWDHSGALVKFVGTLEDVSVKRENQIAIQTRNTQMTMAADLSGLGYWDINLSDNKLFWSDQVYKIHGLLPSEYDPEIDTALSFYDKNDQEIVTEKVNQAIAEGKSFEFESNIIRKDGLRRHVRSIGAPTYDKRGNVIGIFGVFRDITEDKSKEEELRSTMEKLTRSSEELNRFSYVCSHDMREPVRMIEAMSSLLVDPSYTPDEGKRREMLKRINKNTIQLRFLIESLLAFSRVDKRVENANVDLELVLVEIHEKLALLIKENSVNLQVSQMPRLWCAREHIVQVFQNLIENAIKFGDKSPLEIHISSMKSDNGLIIFVDDNGPGIPEKLRDKVFELFGRLKEHDELEGSGLGLSIVQKIVDQYDGTISCSDSPLGGARFEVHFPDFNLK